MQLAQCLVIHLTRRLSHHAGRALGFREGDHFTDRLGTGHQHYQTIETEGQATVGRCAEFQGIEEEAELLLLLVFADAEHTEHRLLHGTVVDTDRTATQFSTVQHHVVGTRQRGGRIGLQLGRAAAWRGKRVVHGGQAAVVVLFEHREVDNPQRRPFAGQQIEVVTELDPQRAQGFANDLGLVGTEEHDVAIDRTDAIKDHIDVVQRDVFHDRRLQAFNASCALVDLDVSQAAGTVDTDELGVIIDLLTRHARPARYTQGGDAAFRVVSRAGEDFKVDVLELIFNIHQLQRVAQVRLVRTITTHGFGQGHMRQLAELDVQDFLEQVADHGLGDAHDVGFVEEAGFDVDLGEFRLTVGTQVFVAEALGDLVVTVEAGHHQQLLEQLWRLRQGEEATGVGTARHQVVTRTFWSGAGEDRRFHVEEAVVVEVTTNAAGDARAQLQLGGHFRAAQVDKAITQAGFFADVGVFVERERRSFRFVQHFQVVAQHFDGAGGHVGVASTGRTQAHLAGDLHHIFAAHAVGHGEGGRAIRVKHHLGQTFTVTDIEENHPAVVTTTVHPTAKGDFLAVQGLVQLAAIVAAHHDLGFS